MGKKPKKDEDREEKVENVASAGRFQAGDRPTPRCHCSLTEVEPGRLLLFGGEVFNGRKFTCFQDVYELVLSQSAVLTWRKLALPAGSKPPQARSAHQAVTWQGSLWILGGEWADAMQDKFLQFKDVWQLSLSGDEAAWKQVAAEKGFSQRSGHRACTHDGSIVVFGGYRDDASGDATYLNDVHRFDLTQLKFRKHMDMSGAAPKARSAAQLWSDGQAVWLYGGSTPAPKQKGVKEHMDALSDIWRLEADMWAGPLVVAGDGPGARSGFASAPLSKADLHLRLFFGGVTDRFGQKKSEFSSFHNDAWILDTKTLSWSRLDLAPGNLQGRIGAQLAAVSAPGRVEAFVLFGGMAEAGPREVTMDDLWCITEPDAGPEKGVKHWSCLLPLSDKTKTWFPDNDSDSSDSDDAEGADKEKSSKKKKGQKTAGAASGKVKAAAKDASEPNEVDLMEEPKAAKKKSRRKKAGKDVEKEEVKEELEVEESIASSAKKKNKGKNKKQEHHRDEPQDDLADEALDHERQTESKAAPKFAPKSRVSPEDQKKSAAKAGFGALADDGSDDSDGSGE